MPPCDTNPFPEKGDRNVLLKGLRQLAGRDCDRYGAILPLTSSPTPCLWEGPPGSPQKGNPLQQTTRELMSANRAGKQARRKATANPGSSGRLPTEVLSYYSQTGFVMLLAYVAVKVPLALSVPTGIVSPGSFQHGTLPTACSMSP